MENSNPNQPLISNCLRCGGLVRIPINAPADSEVKCPHCGEAFLLNEMLEDKIPQLEFVSKKEVAEEVIPRVDQMLDPSDEPEREKFIVPSQLKEGAKRRSRRRSRRSSRAAQADADVGSVSDTGSDSRSKRETVRSRNSSQGQSRRSRRSRSPAKSSSNSPLGEIMKVVLGGFMAIPIAYCLVLFLFKQDPLKLAPTIEQYAPFIIPAELRSEEPRAPEGEGDQITSQAVTVSNAPSDQELIQSSASNAFDSTVSDSAQTIDLFEVDLSTTGEVTPKKRQQSSRDD
ncbi:MAG: hypothetical protein AAF623_08780 [Planctomycetota bacterium]